MHDDDFQRLLSEQPEDRTILLVYADWLEEQGDVKRAEFLRLQDRLLDLSHRRGGLVGLGRQLFRLGQPLDPEWLAVVNRPRLVGTCWKGIDSDGAEDVFRYLPDGILNYTSPTGTFQNGTWTQVGNHVAMEMNRHYADYEGFVGGDRIRGRASNVAGHRWRWDVQRSTDPDVCDPGTPITTIFDDHLADPPPPRPARRRRSRPPAP